MSTAQLADDDDVPAGNRSSTPSSKLPSGKDFAIDDVHRAFFAEGDEGRYEGGFASVESRAREMAALVAEIDRSGRPTVPPPYAKKRRAPRLIVGTVLGACIALLLLATVLKQRIATVEDASRVTAIAKEAQLAPRALLVAPAIAAKPNELPPSEPQPTVAQTAKAVAPLEGPKPSPAGRATPTANAFVSSPTAPRIRAPRRAPAREARPASPSARPAPVGTKPPTASFPLDQWRPASL
jgi:hypothetical protein